MDRTEFLKLLGLSPFAIKGMMVKKADAPPDVPLPEPKMVEGHLTKVDYSYKREYEVPKKRWDEFHEAFLNAEPIRVDGTSWYVDSLSVTAQDPIDVSCEEDNWYRRSIPNPAPAIVTAVLTPYKSIK